MTTEDAILTLTQWLSPAYPVGAFAYSHGLEALVGDGRVKTADDLRAWLEDVLRCGTGLCDARLLAAAWKAASAEAVASIDETARALAASRERVIETDQLGAAFGKVTNDIWQHEANALCYPVALGRAASLQNIPLDLTLRLFLQATVSNLVSAGQRLAPIGQTEAQRLVRDLMPLCHEIAESAKDGDLSNLSSFAFMADIASMRHETQYSRIFRT
ncbi:urease accessory protein UreF [Rhodobacterales bacterium HKCCE4037]|nr:urease accessory protein UreF [Rhodobacterales bacterium HKCCE4037]